MRRYRSALALIAMIASLLSCRSPGQVGDEKLLEFQEQVNDRIGQDTTSPTPGGRSTSDVSPSRKASPKRSVPRTTAPRPSVTITINSDTADTTAFDPPLIRVPAGTIVRWVNKDSVTRSVVADGGEFPSKDLSPGGVHTWTTSKPGRANYHDGTRPYAVGSVEVFAP